MNTQPKFNDMQLVKRRFFAMRNGVVADTLRKAGSPYHIIFGVNLPQIREIADGFTPDYDLACRLWADTRTRESQMLAPWLIPGRRLDESSATEWLRGIVSHEAADILCMAVMRGADYAETVARKMINSDNDLYRYAALRLMLNNLSANTFDSARELAATVDATSPSSLQNIAHQIVDEIDWLTDNE